MFQRVPTGRFAIAKIQVRPGLAMKARVLLLLALSGCQSQKGSEAAKSNPAPPVSMNKLADAMEKKLLSESIGFHSIEDGVFMLRAAERKDHDTITTARERGIIVVLKKDTRFLIQNDSDNQFTKIYVTSGQRYGETLWLMPGSRYWDANPNVPTSVPVAPKTAR